MDKQNTLDSIPTDLLHDIFSRLHIKTVGRCRCVSKILASKLGSEDFKNLFLARSLTRPRFLFIFHLTNEKAWVFYSSPQPQNPYEKSSLEVKADFHSKFQRVRRHDFSYAYGLFYFPGEEDNTTGVIYNPITGQYVMLPKLRTDKEATSSLLGFDPIDKQFKILLINTRASRVNNERIHFILTLGTKKMKWRTIKCPLLRDYPFKSSHGICINGVLYYLTQHTRAMSYAIACFDVRTETFKFKPIAINVQGCTPKLINYKGKLGITILSGHGNTVELDMFEEEKQEWSKYILPSIKFTKLYVVGMTSTDEIVLSTRFGSKLFYVYYFNPEKNTLESVEVQGFQNLDSNVRVFMDYVEDLYVNDLKHFKSKIHANVRQGRFESINTFEALSLG